VQTALFASSTGSSTIDENRETALKLSAVRLTSLVRKNKPAPIWEYATGVEEPVAMINPGQRRRLA
jgi:hypothetical protein